MQRLSSCSQPHSRGRFILEDFHLDLLSVFVLAWNGIRHRRCDLEWPAGGAQSPCDCGRSRVEMCRTPSSTHVRCHLSPQSLGNLIVERLCSCHHHNTVGWCAHCATHCPEINHPSPPTLRTVALLIPHDTVKNESHGPSETSANIFSWCTTKLKERYCATTLDYRV